MYKIRLTKQQQPLKQKVLIVMIVRVLAITTNNHHMMVAQTCKFTTLDSWVTGSPGQSAYGILSFTWNNTMGADQG